MSHPTELLDCPSSHRSSGPQLAHLVMLLSTNWSPGTNYSLHILLQIHCKCTINLISSLACIHMRNFHIAEQISWQFQVKYPPCMLTSFPYEHKQLLLYTLAGETEPFRSMQTSPSKDKLTVRTNRIWTKYPGTNGA